MKNIDENIAMKNVKRFQFDVPVSLDDGDYDDLNATRRCVCIARKKVFREKPIFAGNISIRRKPLICGEWERNKNMVEIKEEEKTKQLIAIIEVKTGGEIIKTELKPEGYALCTILVSGKDFGCDDFQIEQAYSEIGDYIGDPSLAEALYKKGIKPQKISPDSNVCQIGFSEAEQKWFGWSHRAIGEFGIGSTVTKGDCAYKAANKEDFKEMLINFWHNEEFHKNTLATEHTNDEELSGVIIQYEYNEKVKNRNLRNTIVSHFTPYPLKFGRGEWTAETLEDAKQMAIDFAEGVS